MFSLTVRRSFMIAHSLPRESFGPAQGLHGATFVAEVGFRRAELNEDSVVIDIGAAGDLLQEILDRLNYKNLDELPEFAGRLTTTEFLARHIAEQLAEKLPDDAGLAGLDVTLRENPDAWAGYSLDLGRGR
ncbi:6-carboxytetrahydropterin synthase [Arthrobacter sp. Y-9]|uniref:6-pyruvoyl trahydropterin synthase family protein n=1 Tax=Arthrobacter sp. Y-9 TaxID=3039385 RepID=UPI00241D3234|nr:6-carboxytetrahydropterin synthase [Arthrobacter sp. Y-9]WFR83557.1 6-carboxytetrahydropterin synthase [Arthrobacter sp. Y-9]